MDESATTKVVLDRTALDGLISALAGKGYRVIGPTVSDDAVVYDDISSIKDLPQGVGDEQAGGKYRLTKRSDNALFGYTTGAQGWKRQLYPPTQTLFSARRTQHGFEVLPPEAPAQPMALLGVRACELAAMRVQDRVFGDKDFADPGYQGKRSKALIVAVECGQAGATCFCSSMGTGPAVTAGFDIKLVELPRQKCFVAEAGTPLGEALLAEINAPPATAADIAAAAARLKGVKVTKTMDAETARALDAHTDHPQWADVATRCMSCGNCTMVCPTCFCSTVEDVTDLKGDTSERVRKWDSCFSIDFSYIHGGALRTEARSRYRQWITHKLSFWYGQFDTSGCVGCGRCITWCPVGIDITEEVSAIKRSQGGK
jgi:ferredoxin